LKSFLKCSVKGIVHLITLKLNSFLKEKTVEKIILPFIFCLSLTVSVFSQKRDINPQDTVPVRLFEKKYNEKYERNIKKSRINGVYIPKNIAEAHNELKALSQPESLSKFKSAEKFFVVDRLHYGLGRWMIVNSRFTLLTLHDVLNNIEPDIEQTVKHLVDERAALLLKKQGRN